MSNLVLSQLIVLEDKEEYMAGIPKSNLEKLQREPFETLVLCNPRLQPVGVEGYRYWEGCLSIRGYQVCSLLLCKSKKYHYKSTRSYPHETTR